MTGPAATSVSRIDLVLTNWGAAAVAAGAATDATGVALVVTVCPNNGVPIAAATSGSKNFMRKVFLTIDAAGPDANLPTGVKPPRSAGSCSAKSVVFNPAPDAENVSRLDLWIELNVIAAPMPDIPSVAQQIVHLIDIALH